MHIDRSVTTRSKQSHEDRLVDERGRGESQQLNARWFVRRGASIFHTRVVTAGAVS